MVVTNRKQIEKLIYDTFDALDPSGANTTKYREMFDEMDEKAFQSFFKEYLANDEENFILDIVEFEHSLQMDYCEAAAKVLGIPLMEHVYMPHLTMDKANVIVSKQPCLVGYLNVKRTQQLLHKKNGLSVSNEKKSPQTGQVIGDDKNARDSDIESAMLVALGAEKILQELHGPRADDPVMNRQMKQQIATKGYVMLDELENDSKNKITLNTVNTYLLSMGLKSDLITPTYILPKTSDEIFN
jgi:hypothetical protein